MKKNYETPNVEVVKFQYKDQVVAQSGGCGPQVVNAPAGACQNPVEIYMTN